MDESDKRNCQKANKRMQHSIVTGRVNSRIDPLHKQPMEKGRTKKPQPPSNDVLENNLR